MYSCGFFNGKIFLQKPQYACGFFLWNLRVILLFRYKITISSIKEGFPMTIQFFIFTITVAKNKKQTYPPVPGYKPSVQEEWLDRKSAFSRYM